MGRIKRPAKKERDWLDNAEQSRDARIKGQYRKRFFEAVNAGKNAEKLHRGAAIGIVSDRNIFNGPVVVLPAGSFKGRK